MKIIASFLLLSFVSCFYPLSPPPPPLLLAFFFVATQVVTTLNYVFMNSERERGPFLVVVPLTTIEHWRREVEAWTEMNLCVYHDSGGRDMRDLIREYEWYYSGR